MVRTLGMWYSEEDEGVLVGDTLDATKIDPKDESVEPAIDIENTQAVGKAIAKEIEDWLKENEGSEGQVPQGGYSWTNFNIEN